MVIPFLNRFLHWLVVGIMTTVLSLNLLSRGAGLGELGLLLGTYGLVVALLELPSGILSDLLGRKRIYLLSLILSALGYLCLIPARGFLALLSGLVLIGTARAFSSGSVESLFISQELAREGEGRLDHLLRAMGLGESLGLALGALLGGLLPLAWVRLFPLANRYDADLLAQILGLVILFVLTLRFVHEGVNPKEGRGRRLGAALRQGLSQPLVALLLLASLFWGLCLGTIETWWQPRLRDILGSDSRTWVFGLVNGGYFLASLLGVLVTARLPRSISERPLGFLALARLALGGLMVVLALQTSLGGFALVYLSMFFFNGLASVPEGTVLNKAIPEAGRSSILSIASLAVQLGGAATSFAAAAFVPRFGIVWAWILAGLLFAASSACYLLAAGLPSSPAVVQS